MTLGWVKRRIWPGNSSASRAFDLYVSAPPSWQNAVEAVGGWKTSFPPQFELTAGSLASYADPRILWAIDCFGPLAGRRVLELGPLDGGHTAMLEAAGATVDAVEADHDAFMRCLIAREIFGLTRSTFWLGDFMKALEHWEARYDLIVASGVLYHVADPLRLIELAARRSDAIYIWTHLMGEQAMPPSDPRRGVFTAPPEIHRFHDLDVRVYRRVDAEADDDAASCSDDGEQRWLDRDDLLRALGAVGFHDIRLGHDEPDHRNGPALSIFARR